MIKIQIKNIVHNIIQQYTHFVIFCKFKFKKWIKFNLQQTPLKE